MSNKVNYLQEVLRIARDLEQQLRPTKREEDQRSDSEEKRGRDERCPPLTLEINSESIRQSLSTGYLCESTIESLVQIYEEKLEIFASLTRAKWEQLYRRSCNHGEQAHSYDRLRLALTGAFIRHQTELKEVIVSEVRKRIELFGREARSLHLDNESTDEDETNRGHSKLAVTILEKAYSYSTNITTAERNKLADATNLSRRQVTIWFQNRRNRRTSLKRKYSADHVQRCRLPETGHNPACRNAVAADSTTLSSASLTSSVDTSCSLRHQTQECGSSGNSYDDTLATSIISSSDDLYRRGLHDVRELFSEWMDSKVIGSDDLIFNGSGPQLDLDDLELNLEDFKSGILPYQFMIDPRHIPIESVSTFGKTRLTHPPSDASGHSRDSDASKAELFASVLADELDKQNVDSEELVRRSCAQESWGESWGQMLQEKGETAHDFLSLEGMSCPFSDQSTRPAEALSELDFFLSGLEIDKIMADNYRSFYCHEAGDSRPFGTLGDLELQTA